MRSLVALALGATLLAGCTVPRPGRWIAALSRPGLLGRQRDERHHLWKRPRPRGQPGQPQARPLPAGRRHTIAKRPALVWVHGGGFTAGSKSSGRARATFFAQLGYVAVSIDYRLLSPDGCGGNPNPTPICRTAAQAAQHDAQAAVDGCGPTRRPTGSTPAIAIAGGSAGAVTSCSSLATRGSRHERELPATRQRFARRSRCPAGCPPTSLSPRATARHCSSTEPRTRWSRTSGRSRTPPRCTTSASLPCSSRSRARATVCPASTAR